MRFSLDFARTFHDQQDLPAISSQEKIREAILLLFCDPIPAECLHLWLRSRNEWQKALRWLDVSGLALYFLDRLEQRNICGLVPEHVLARLRRNLADNTARTAALVAEWTAIQHSFLDAGLSYANLKGFSLGTASVPKPELRSQLDFDFLVAAANAPIARRILEDRGYHMRFSNDRSWEFSAHDTQPLSLRDLYKATPHRYVELHLECAASPSGLLERLEMRRVHNLAVPVLNPVDLFLGQGLHVYKHLRGQFTRAAHLVEFRSHVIARTSEAAFWHEVLAVAERDPRHPIGLGVVILLITRLMGDFAPQAITECTVDRLPPAVRLWIDTYAHDAILGGSPGTKLYLLLHEALAPAEASGRRLLRRELLPRIARPLVLPPQASEGLVAGLRRHWQQLRFVLVRVHFHLVEGFAYVRYLRRWRRALRTIAS